MAEPNGEHSADEAVRMITYEDLANLLLDQAEEVGLEPLDVSHLVEWPAGRRTFTMYCVPEDWDPPFDIVAELRFSYEAMDVALSHYGQEELCAMYHDPGVPCPHLGIPPDLTIVLEVKYQFQPPDVYSVPEVTGELRRLFRQHIPHDNQPEMKFEVSSLPDASLQVHQAYAYYWWELREELFEEEPDFTDVFREIHAVIDAIKASGLIEGHPREDEPFRG